MTKDEFKKSLSEALENFRADTQSSFDEMSNEPATKGDIADLAKMTFYALNDFRNALIKYLE